MSEQGQDTAVQATGNDAAPDPMAEVRDLLNFDPFEKPPSKPDAASGQQGEAPAAEAKQTPAPDVPPGQSEQTPTDSTPPQTQQQLDQQLAEIRQMLAQQQQTQAPAKPEEGPKFNFQPVPEKLAQAMASEDLGERSQGYTTFANAIANTIWQQVQAEVQAVKSGVAQAIPAYFQHYTSLQRQQEMTAQDFYGKYPQYKSNPVLMQLVHTVATQMAQEQVAAGRQFQWTPEFRDALHGRLQQHLAAVAGQASGAAPRPAVAPQRYASGTNGSRGSAATQSAVAKDIAETFDGFF